MVRTTTYLAAVALAIPLLVIQRLLVVRRRLRALTNLPTDIVLFDPKLPLPLPNIKWISRERGWGFRERFTRFSAYGSDIICQVSIFPLLDVTYRLADAKAITEVFGRRAAFKAPPEQLGVMKSFGDPNLVASDDEVHKRQRKAIAPAFTERNMQMVWDEAFRVAQGVFQTEEWCDKQRVSIDHALDMMAEVMMHVIASCGFGRKLSFDRTRSIPAGHKMSLEDAVRQIAHHSMLKILVPRWLSPINKKWSDAHTGYEEVRKYTMEIIAQRIDGRTDGADLLSLLLAGADKEDDDTMRLTPDEVTNNVIILLLGGHETSSAVFAFLLGELAIDPDLQERLRQSLLPLLPADGSPPPYENLAKYSFAVAVITETLRMYPIPNNYAKKCVVDTVVQTDTPGLTLVVPAGTMMEINHIGLHYNPKYYPEPYEFKPERFMGKYNTDAFVGFGSGTRSCPGRKFAEVEMVALLCMFLSRYTIELPDTPEFRNLHSKAELRAKLLAHTVSLGLVPERVPLTFVRRN
ncbi:cytochrome P450 [Auriculariales sp. MPI-PUGE-AT-0066]|nr:cytochrome P450 [Auriculariales sp. MPI-PUGE-AT-0066]